jgi:hypothetical protein
VSFSEIPDYRVYSLDPGNELRHDWLDADDDEEAIKTVASISAGSKRELWHKDRLVATCPPTDSSAG